MNINQIIKHSFIGLLFINFLITNNIAQMARLSVVDSVEESDKTVSDETYNRVLDIVFSSEDSNSREIIYSFILRFKPYSQPESQIVIRKRIKSIEITEFRSESGIIFNKLNGYLKQYKMEDAVEMAKTIKISQRKFIVSNDKFKKWYDDFFESVKNTNKILKTKGEEFDKTGSETVLLDGGNYSLRYKQRLNKISFDLYDVDIADIADGTDYDLTKWMFAVSREIQNFK